MRRLIAGNWKMNGLSKEGTALARAIRENLRGSSADVLVCPPATQIAQVANILEGSEIAVGGQDCHVRNFGPHTGEISATMLRDVGASFVILGHSERRAGQGESSTLIAQKVTAASEAGLVPIVCIGETAEDREQGQHEAVVGAQLAGSLPPEFGGIVAYEPIWAIGTGRVATRDDIAAMHSFIQLTLVQRHAMGSNTRILYGGSVRPGNISEVLGVPNVDGALVGGASLAAEDFLKIVHAA